MFSDRQELIIHLRYIIIDTKIHKNSNNIARIQHKYTIAEHVKGIWLLGIACCLFQSSSYINYKASQTWNKQGQEA